MSGIKYLLAALLTIALVSCNKEKSLFDTTNWGREEYFDDFLFYKYEPSRLTKTLNIEFNEDASDINNIRFALYKDAKSSKKSYIKASDGVELYKNGQLCSDNILTVGNNDGSEVEVGIGFNEKASFQSYKFYLGVYDGDGLTRINDTEMEGSSLPVIMEWKGEYAAKMNPLKLGLLLMLGFIVSAMLLWLLVIKPLAVTTIKVGKFQITTPANGFVIKKSSGYKRIVITGNRNLKQSFINSLFTGKILYIYCDDFKSKWEFVPSRNTCKPLRSSEYLMDFYSGNLDKGVDYDYTIVTTNQKGTIKIF